MRLLVALDYSPCSSAACKWALERVAGLEVEQLIFHHVLDPAEVPQKELGALERASREVRIFVAAQGTVPEGVEVRYAVSVGKPAEQILAAVASHRVGAVVMGTNGRRGLDRLLLGSVAETVVREAPCTVIVVKPDTPQG